MATSYDAAYHLKKDLEMEYQERHSIHQKLRDYWHGKYWEQLRDDRTGLQSLFRDIARERPTNGPDYQVIHNLIQECCLKYQTYLSTTPMIKVYRDPGKKKSDQQATKKERYLYGTWGQRPLSMSAVMNRMAWYLPLLGDCFLGAFPDLENNVVRPLLRSPEIAFPVQNYDGQNLDCVMFAWETTRSKAQRAFAKYDPDKASGGFLRRKVKKEKIEILEWSDGDSFYRWVDGQEVAGVEHEYKFNLFDQVGFVFVPDEPWNHGAAEQALTMNDAENLVRSLLLQAVVENVFPKYVLIDPSKAPEELDMGPGAVWGVNQGGDVKTLAPPLQALPVQQGFLAENERAVKQSMGVNEANFGTPRGSIVTGKAINEMESAGAGSIVEMVQGVGLGAALVSWNEKALCLGQKAFSDETMNLSGVELTSAVAKQHFSMSIKGSELVGGYRNDVVFLPHLNDHEKLVMGLQGIGAGIFSKEHVRNTVGIPDSKAMDEEILGERLQEIVVAAIEQELLAAPTPEAADDAESRAVAYLQGASPAPARPAGAPLPGPGQAPVPPALPPALGGGGAPALPAQAPPSLPGLPSQPATPPEQPQESAEAGGGITLETVVPAFQNVQVQGRVFLVGEIVQTGRTSDEIEVAVTDDADKQTLSDALSFPMIFHTVPGEPDEPHIEVTPGAVPEQRGEEPSLEL